MMPVTVLDPAGAELRDLLQRDAVADSAENAVLEQIRQELYIMGTHPGLVGEICVLLREKSIQIQCAFLLRMCGYTQAEIGEILGVWQKTVSRWLQKKCADIKNLLKTRVKYMQTAYLI